MDSRRSVTLKASDLKEILEYHGSTTEDEGTLSVSTSIRRKTSKMMNLSPDLYRISKLVN